MLKLKWFLIGIALTAFSSDYIRMKAQQRSMESAVTLSDAAALRAQVTSTACLVELASNRALIESWEIKTRLISTARVEALNTVDRAKDGDAEALASLKDLGYAISGANKRLITLRGIGGP